VNLADEIKREANADDLANSNPRYGQVAIVQVLNGPPAPAMHTGFGIRRPLLIDLNYHDNPKGTNRQPTPVRR
jgi:hypothetical protein